MEDTGANTPRSGNEDRPFQGVPPLSLGGLGRQHGRFQNMDDVPPPQTPPPYEGKADFIISDGLQAESGVPQTSTQPFTNEDDITIVIDTGDTGFSHNLDMTSD